MSGIVHIAVDAESGDFGAEVVLRGVIAARRDSDTPFVTHLCGDGPNLEKTLAELLADKNLVGQTAPQTVGQNGGQPADKIVGQNIRPQNVGQKTTPVTPADFIIEHCPEVITDEDKRATVWKNKRMSSVVRCVALQEEGIVRASVSAGDTGVLVGSALFILGREDGVERPALGAFIPTPARPVFVMDVGANINCRSEHLVNFARLGVDYLCRLYGRDDVTAGLLNVGTEPSKGPKVVRDAADELKSCKNYAGFVEGNKLFSSVADVVVCDGFLGNVLLKTCESFYSLAAGFLHDSRDALETLKNKIDALNPENYGAVPFLGINGTVLKAHGRSSSRSIRNAVLTAVKTLSP